MTDPEIRLKCMEMAITQARVEGFPGNREYIASTQDWFYARIVVSLPKEPVTEPKQDGRSKSKADKGPQIFE